MDQIYSYTKFISSYATQQQSKKRIYIRYAILCCASVPIRVCDCYRSLPLLYVVDAFASSHIVPYICKIYIYRHFLLTLYKHTSPTIFNKHMYVFDMMQQHSRFIDNI